MTEGVLLDTNVWRYLSDANAYVPLLTASHQAGLNIVVAPAAVYESLAIPDPALRKRVMTLMARSRWKRLMPEAFSECEELRSELMRLRPQWIVSEPDLRHWDRLRRDWTRPKHGFWSRLTEQTDEMANWTRFPYLEQAREQSRGRRQDLIKLKTTKWKVEPFADVSGLPGGRTGERVPLWKVEAANASWFHLTQRGGPYRDWLSPWLDETRITRSSWNIFWFREVGNEATPRHRIRSRIEWLQGFYTVTTGTPGDSQLSSYLLDADYIVTSDGNFAAAIAECAATLPFKIASPLHFKAGEKCVTQLLEWFGKRAVSRSATPSARMN